MDYQKELIKTYRNKIFSPFLRAIKDYSLIEENDKIAVCMSGGKDSFLMALCFKEILKYTKIPFEVEYLVMDPGYKDEHLQEIKMNAELLNIDIKIFRSNIFKITSNQEKNKCYICAKMRRGALYNEAKKLGCNKIALGHHYDDAIETLLMSILYQGEVAGMRPIVKSDNYNDMYLIRPMYYVREKDIIDYADNCGLHFLKYACFMTSDITLCSSSKRQVIKKLIKELDNENEYVSKNIFKAQSNVNLNKLISYKLKNKTYKLIKEKLVDVD
ncbi:tRNA 2-thiocytidine biosynthesis protein TtcA [bacterium]|nr:tRNA 2-thiocytidine biosynthesis protein TtcA [bacterium]